ICYIKNAQSCMFIVISAIDVVTGERAAGTKAILGSSGNIYCNENNVYITSNNFKRYFDETNFTNYIHETTTDIIKVEINSDEIRFVASGRVDGYVNNQFSMDEKDGYFRIATTDYNILGNETNVLYVLDKNLNFVGKTDVFAKGESIKAVRYIDDMAYVITFEQIDPLFVIDLSIPENPILKGSLEIDGFSSLLVPISENQLLGIGYQTEETEGGTVTCGLKLVLFDISDAENPTALDIKDFYQFESEVQSNHKALVVNREKGYYAIPYDDNSNFGEGERKSGVLTFEINNDKIEITNKFKSDIVNQFYFSTRCVYIDDYIYIFGISYLDNDTQEFVINSYKY
ncbi:MAG: beta-propeller domain-containing protein, partial [Eubacterium sp.]|nr:beta-propeller domain-containing protein [Eubacterium sp.]